MNNDDFNHFVCIVAGENPESLMAKYDKNIKGEKKVVVPYAKAKEFRDAHIKLYEKLLEESTENEDISYARLRLEIVKEEDVDEFFREEAKEKGYEIDPENGDMITYGNIDGKWRYYELGHFFSIPFKLKDGSEAYTAKKCDIDWEKMHLCNQEVYEGAWEMVMEGREPKTENEKLIYENMKERTVYFMKYGDKDTYVISNTAFWGYAFLSELTGWHELEPNVNQYVWVKNYYNQYIAPLPEDTKLTIFECVK